jgi:predicted Zn-dependent protease
MRLVASSLVAAAVATFVAGTASASLFDSSSDTGYPDKGKAIELLKPASDYGDILAYRPRALSIIRARDNGFVPSPELHTYLRGVLMRVLAGVTLPASFQPDVRVLASPEFEALCTPDGTIVVSVGLLEKLDNEDELAFVLGHEVSHAIYRHHGSDWFDRSQYYAVMSGAAVDKMSEQQPSLASSAGFNKSEFERGLDLAQHVYKLSSNVLVPQFKKGQEDAADALGFDLMAKAGYSSEAANAVLDDIAKQEAEAESDVAAAKAAEKDGGGSKQNKLAVDLFGSGGLPDLSSLNVATLFTWDKMIKLFDDAVDSMSGEATTHHPAKEREKLLSDYEFREYRHLLPKPPKPLPWTSSPSLKAAMLLAHYARAEEAWVALSASQPDLARAQKPMLLAVSPPTADHAYTEYVASLYFEQSRSQAQSEAALVKAVSGPEPSWQVYARLANLYIGRQAWPKAQALMDQALTRFDNSPVLLPKRIQVLHGAGRQQEAEALLPQCDQYDIHELSDECKKAAGKG